LADWLAAPPAVYAHLPFGTFGKKSQAAAASIKTAVAKAKTADAASIIEIAPSTIRLLALKRSWDGRALIVRLQETQGKRTAGRIKIAGVGEIRAKFDPFEIVTLRIDRAKGIREVDPIDEK
jgi:alpha-mannosidase